MRWDGLVLLGREVAHQSENASIRRVWMAAADGVTGDTATSRGPANDGAGIKCLAMEERAELALVTVLTDTRVIEIGGALGEWNERFEVRVDSQRCGDFLNGRTYRGHDNARGIAVVPAPVGAGLVRQVFEPDGAVVNEVE